MLNNYSKSVLIFILFAGFLAYEMAIQVSPGVLTEPLMHDLHIDAWGLGLMSGCYYYTYTLLQVPAGLLLDRYPLAKVMFFPIFLCALGAILFGCSSTVLEASFARMLMGMGSAFAFIAILVAVVDVFPARHFALLAGTTQLLAAVGAMVGGWPLVPLFSSAGWQRGMIYLGVLGLGLVLAIIIWGRYPKPARLNAMDKSSLLTSLRVVFNNAQTWYIALYACLLWAPMAAFASLWGIPYLQEAYQLTHASAAAFNALLWAGLAIGSPLLGWWSDSIGRRKLPLACAAALGLNSIAGLLYFNEVPLWGLGILLFLTGVACSGQALSFALVKENHLPNNSAVAIGFNNMAVVVAGALFQPLIGKLIQLQAVGQLGEHIQYSSQHYRFGLNVLPLCFSFGLFISLFLIRETYNKNRYSPIK